MTFNGGQWGRQALKGVLVIVVFVLGGLAGALIWRAVAPLPHFTRTAQGMGMDAIQLSQMVGIDGWFGVVAAPLALLLGVASIARCAEGVVMRVLAIAIGSALAAVVMVFVGGWMGPGSPAHALAHAAVGTTARTQLELQATGVAYFWPGFALLGALIVLLIAAPQGVPSVDTSSAGVVHVDGWAGEHGTD